MREAAAPRQIPELSWDQREEGEEVGAGERKEGATGETDVGDLEQHDILWSELCCRMRSGLWGSLEFHYFPQEKTWKVGIPGWSNGADG